MRVSGIPNSTLSTPAIGGRARTFRTVAVDTRWAGAIWRAYPLDDQVALHFGEGANDNIQS